MTLASDSAKVLEILIRHSEGAGTNAPMLEARALAERTGLPAERLAAAVEALVGRGHAAIDEANAEAPCTFGAVALTPGGRDAHEAAHRDRERADEHSSSHAAVKPEAPKLIRNLAWFAQYGRRHWVLVSLAALVVVFGFALGRGLLPFDTGWGSDKSVTAEKRRSLSDGLRELSDSPDRYQVALMSLDKGLELLDITSVTTGSRDTRIDFRYRGHTTLNLNRLDYKRNLASGAYAIRLPVLGMNRVNVTLTFNEDGTADGQWSSSGLSDRFDIVVKRP